MSSAIRRIGLDASNVEIVTTVLLVTRPFNVIFVEIDTVDIVCPPLLMKSDRILGIIDGSSVGVFRYTDTF